MNYLLDTHVLLWAAAGTLSPSVAKYIGNESNVSQAHVSEFLRFGDEAKKEIQNKTKNVRWKSGVYQ